MIEKTMDKIALAIATGMYTGYLPKFPGTWGTLTAIPIHFVIIMLAMPYYYGALAGILILAIITAGIGHPTLQRILATGQFDILPIRFQLFADQRRVVDVAVVRGDVEIAGDHQRHIIGDVKVFIGIDNILVFDVLQSIHISTI